MVSIHFFLMSLFCFVFVCFEKLGGLAVFIRYLSLASITFTSLHFDDPNFYLYGVYIYMENPSLSLSLSLIFLWHFEVDIVYAW